MTDLLALARERGCESELADKLSASLETGQLPDMAGEAYSADLTAT
jgi:hypothetical protein